MMPEMQAKAWIDKEVTMDYSPRGTSQEVSICLNCKYIDDCPCFKGINLHCSAYPGTTAPIYRCSLFKDKAG